MKLFKTFIFITLVISGVFLLKPKKLESADLASVKDTLSSSRLSFVGALASGNTAGSTVVTIKTTGLPGWATSDDNLNLFTGDSLLIGTTSPYTVIDVVDDASDDQILIYRSGGLGVNDAQVDDPVIATRSAQHTVTFTPVSAIDGGYYRVRIKATAGTQFQSQDGIPDADGFDFTDSFATGYVDCPDSATPTVEYSGDTHCPTGYTCILCNYTGINTLAAKTLKVGTTAAAEQPINPSPSSDSAEHGKAGGSGGYDLYAFYVDHLDSAYAVIDSTWGKIAVIDSVRVTAVVEPTIEFEINGIATGETACGSALSVTSTATTIPFGTVAIGSFINAAQTLIISTNAAGGYSVTTMESDQLNRMIGTGLDTATSIPDTPGDDSAASHTTKDEWESTATKGFGYSLEQDDVGVIAFEYTDTDGGCTGGAGTFCAKQFADDANDEPAQEIFSATTVADSQNAYICYRVIVSTTQQAGTYTNSITHIASATF